jgi:hypothetical protein
MILLKLREFLIMQGKYMWITNAMKEIIIILKKNKYLFSFVIYIAPSTVLVNGYVYQNVD